MYSKEEKDFITGIYRCKDDIKNLKLRVRLECIRSSAIPHENDLTGSATGRRPGGTGSSSGGPTSDSANCLEEIEISWQQRILSADEIARYSSVANCYTKQQEKWHREILANQHPRNRRIFTYTHRDEVLPEHEREIFCHNEKHPTHLEWNERAVRQILLQSRSRTPAPGPTGPGLTARSIVNDNPSRDTKLMNRTLSTPLETMYVFVQLATDLNNEEDLVSTSGGAGTAPPPRTNYHLASLAWDPDRRVLSITPDLCSGPADTYKIDTQAASDAKAARIEFRYALSVVAQAGRESWEREMVTEQLLWKKPPPISLEGAFDIPRQGVYSVFVTGEIVSAAGFEYNHLFVQYFVHLPEGWSCEDSNKIYGVTQKCRFRRKTRVAHFSFPFEFKLSLNLACLEAEDSDLRGHPYTPQLLFEIGSLDSWGRYRNEGYAWAPLPRTPGRACLHLTSVRPGPRSPLDELCRAFIGSSLQISDLTYVGKPSGSVQNSTLSKYGFRTVPSGTLNICLNIAHQSHVSKAPDKTRTASVYLLERLSANTLLNNINSVIEAFQRARQRMLLVRAPLMSAGEADG
ncbi:hypothetical protein M8J77_006500 [Diaphorina citri]|nr:hypothetical protein M8J77_006500 [Diaphorina citri]